MNTSTRSAVLETTGQRSFPLVVRDRSLVADDVVSLVLERPDGTPLPEWEPGAHIDLVLGNGLTRQYSLCSDPLDRGHWRIGVRRDAAGRGGSSYVFDSLFAGDSVAVRGPRNNFRQTSATRFVFVAGGIGITPIIPMIEAARRSGTPWTLHYGGRSRASMPFLDQLEGRGDVHVVPQDEAGFLDLPTILRQPDESGTAVYMCGPEGMLSAAEGLMQTWPPGSLHLERFAPKTDGGLPENVAFDVEFTRTGDVVTISPEESILSVAEELGLDVFASCREGTCGTCVTAIVGGRAEHRDSLLTEEEQDEQDQMLICVSRADRDCGLLRIDL